MRCFSGCLMLVIVGVVIVQVFPFVAPLWQGSGLTQWLEQYGFDSDWGEKGEYLSNIGTQINSEDCQQPVATAKYQQAWSDLQQGKNFKLDIKIESEPRCQATQFRNTLEIATWKNDYDYWKQVYVSLIQFDSPKMKPLIDKFEQLREEEQLTSTEFAEAVITFIQNIPYVLILNKTAKEALKDGEFYRTYIEVEKRPYIENIKHGIHSPIEFLHTQQGDCDTRTVLAYTILSYFDYDVAIINSPDHSMIGIHLPAYGDHIVYHGKKYFLWETTQPGWALGIVSPEHRKNLQVCVPSLHSH